ncbi:MAG: DUF368 domain-containing protein [Clostridiales bacterium]|nr:DUF368 domain-containing protein [Clostridiales bacterium]
MGIANVIPGVSGGTIAVILDIFDDLINIINNFTKEIKKNILFLTPIILGVIFSILSFSSLVNFCIINYSVQTNLFFIGLIIGSIPVIFKKAGKNSSKNNMVTSILFLFFSIFLVIFISRMSLKQNNTVSHIDKINNLFLSKIFVSGILSATAMVIPGVSGSFIMILLGTYNIIIQSISNLVKFKNFTECKLEIKILVISAIGIVIGIIFASKIISLLLKKFSSITYFCILGLVIGSIYGVILNINFDHKIIAYDYVTSFIFLLIGSTTSYSLGDKSK